MPRAAGIKNFPPPIGGLNTDQSPLAPVENTTIDEDNMDFTADMNSRVRRLGLNAEPGSSFLTPVQSINNTLAFNWTLWESVALDSRTNFHVIQVGRTLYFIQDVPSPLTDGVKGFTFDLTTIKVSSATDADVDSGLVDFSSGKGVLIVVGEFIEPTYIEYDPATDTITGNKIELRVRDFDGLDDGLGVDERPATLSDEHKYNLKNQGWGKTRNNKSTVSRVDYDDFQAVIGAYPSNADVAHLGVIDDGSGVLKFDPEFIKELDLGNTSAPKGHFVIDPFNIKYDDLVNSIISGSPVYRSGSSQPAGGGASLGIAPSWWGPGEFDDSRELP